MLAASLGAGGRALAAPSPAPGVEAGRLLAGVPGPDRLGEGPPLALAAPVPPQSPQPADAPRTTPPVYQWRVLAAQDDNTTPGQSAAPRAPAGSAAGTAGQRVLDWDSGAGKSYLIPGIELPSFLVLLNLYDRTFLETKTQEGSSTYDSNPSTIWQHLRKQNWTFDRDPFNVNQIGHPYQGATMYAIARSTGLNFWESLLYSNLGSFTWEMAGETSRPSINDLITTGNSGSLLGEALFRMSQLVLKEDAPRPDAWHEAGAALLSPPTGFNRWAYGERFKPIFTSDDPALFWRARLGASISGSSRQAAVLDFQMSYGLPGKPGYSYRRPLDYFDFQIGGLSEARNPISYVLLRGLLVGRDYHVGENYRGIWGLYGGYDYLSPTNFRVSTTALSLGTTGQYWLAPGIALQGSVLGGFGFGAAGKTPVDLGKRDYHYGATPQVLLATRLLFGNRTALELIGRGYYVSGTGSDDSQGYEQIARINAGFTVRVFRRHGIGLQFVESLRYAHYGSLPRSKQADGTISLVYTFLGDSHLGAVEWRDLGSR
ncbi:hypothetical protein GMST_24020 [Geomonas silvestris]|uniref:DUF3943 domain-containing protein n=1 Tax=Geomonas silvestris TaxID=2740184 RepID=A0A6V8MJE3_9BACT|nr:hypothetical protein GMST_24020 [Geomonas silvestris]